MLDMLDKIKDYIKKNNPDIKVDPTDLVSSIHVALSTDKKAMSLEFYPDDKFEDIEKVLKNICDELK